MRLYIYRCYLEFRLSSNSVVKHAIIPEAFFEPVLKKIIYIYLYDPKRFYLYIYILLYTYVQLYYKYLLAATRIVSIFKHKLILNNN